MVLKKANASSKGLTCSECDSELLNCDECNKEFEIGDEIFCEYIDRHAEESHYCSGCKGVEYGDQ